jgi:hypothetical protein
MSFPSDLVDRIRDGGAKHDDPTIKVTARMHAIGEQAPEQAIVVMPLAGRRRTP